MEWISVNDRLPEVPVKSYDFGVAVIACYRDYLGNLQVRPLEYERATVRKKVVFRWKWMFGNRIFDGGEVLYWMPLPTPPEG